MSDIQQKIMGCAQRQENMTENKNKNQSIETDPEMTNKTDLVDKDIKIIVTTIFLYSRRQKKEQMW